MKLNEEMMRLVWEFDGTYKVDVWKYVVKEIPMMYYFLNNKHLWLCKRNKQGCLIVEWRKRDVSGVADWM